MPRDITRVLVGIHYFSHVQKALARKKGPEKVHNILLYANIGGREGEGSVWAAQKVAFSNIDSTGISKIRSMGYINSPNLMRPETASKHKHDHATYGLDFLASLIMKLHVAEAT